MVSRASNASGFLSFALFELGPTLVDVAIGLSYLTAVYGPAVSTILVATGAGFFVTMLTTRVPQARLRSTRLDREDDVASIRTEALSNADLVRCFAAEAYESSRYKGAVCRQQRAAFDSTLLSQTTYLAETLVTDFGVLLGALVVARQITLGQKDIGTFVTYISYAANTLSRSESVPDVSMAGLTSRCP